MSRAFIVKNAAEYDQIDIATFVSVSTPWGGVNTATMGIEKAPAVIPSWYDVAPGSDFLLHLYDQPLPAETMFYLIFSIRGECSILMGNNDGTVETASQVDYRAQKESVRVFPINEDHGTIIHNEYVIDLILALLTGETEQVIDHIFDLLAEETGR